MSLIIKDKDILHYTPIIVPFYEDKWEIRSLDSVPQQVKDCTPQGNINASESHRHFVVTSHLPGVALKDLWVYIEGRTLTIYAGVTARGHEKCVYRYIDELLGGIRREIILPERAHQRPEKARFSGRTLYLYFPKRTDGLLLKKITAAQW